MLLYEVVGMDITGGNGINDYYLYNGNFLIMANSVMETVKDIVTILTPVALAIIAYKQVQLNNKQKVIGTQIDGMKSELVDAVAGRNKAEGQLQGMEKAKKDAVEIKVQGVQEVKIVEQAKPIDVKVKKEGEK